MKRRLVIIVLALILAAVGTGGVLAYARGANARAIAGMKAVSVLVAQKKIPSGTTAAAALREGLLSSQKLPASAVPAQALGSIGPSLSTLVLSADLQPGQLLLRPMLVTAAQTANGLAIPPGMMALTLSFCLPEVVAGAVQAGSQVAVFDTVGFNTGGSLSAVPGCSGAHTQTGGTIRTRVVLTRVQVLSVGTAQAGGTSGTSTASALSGSSAASSSSQSGSLVTLAVTQAQAEQLIQMSETGMPYLALLTSNSHTTSDAGHLLTAHPAPSSQPSPVVTFPLVVPSGIPTPPVTPTTPAPAPQPTQTIHKRK